MANDNYHKHIASIVIKEILLEKNASECHYYGTDNENAISIELICKEFGIKFIKNLDKKIY